MGLRKFLAFLIVLAIITVLAVLKKGETSFPYLVGALGVYMGGNAASKFSKSKTNKEQQSSSELNVSAGDR